VTDAVSTPKVIRFGTYEVDLRSGELRKNGLKVRLTGQPFQILTILLERPGELVPREELQKRLWPGDTFVDFDSGLNAAVNRVREALGDSAENPRFVETLPKRGYRFIGQVEGPQRTKSTESQPAVDSQRNEIAGRGWKIGIAAGSVILLAAFGLLVPTIARRFLRQPRPPLLEAVPLTTLPGEEISPSFSPDGSQVAFGWNGENDGAGFDLYVKVIGTDKPLRLTNHPVPWLGVAWSPDGRSIAVTRLAAEDRGIFLVPALGGPERKLVSTNNFALWAPNSALSWSPDGKQLAFADGSPLAGYSTQIFLLSLDTLERKRMETGCDWTFSPGFSPLGDSLVYICLRDDGDYSLNLLDLREGKNKRLFSGPLRIRDPMWTRDGMRIIFSYGSGATPFVGAGGNLWQITPGRTESPEKMPFGHDGTSATVSSSGNRLAYVQTQISGNIWRVDLDGAKAKARILVTSTREQYGPLISPDGGRIIFMSNRSGTGEIWVCDSDGSNAHQLTSSGGAGTPRWSPDGKQIVFDSRVGGEANVYVIDANGGVPRKLETGTRMNSLPSWSHDGKWIYFGSGSTRSNLTLWRVGATGGHAVQLTKTASIMPIESPDGQYVYFVRFTEGQFRLWRIRPDGSGESMVNAMPPLSSDGYEWWPFKSGIYFYAYKDGNAEIDLLDLPTSRVRRISTLDKPPAPWMGGLSVSPDGKWFLYSRIDETASDLMLVENFH
jgi:Tol biopolymer transport system component/DNA-binding winged helix-turn-helix (wHTH) protein